MAASTQVNREAAAPWVLLDLFHGAAGLPSLPESAALASEFRLCDVGRGGTLFMQDSAHPYVYAVRSGLLKLVYLDEGGNEWIKSFTFEGRYFASIAALVPGGRASFMVRAIEDSIVERVDYRLLEQLAARHLEWARALLVLTQQFAARKELREKELLTLTAEERYVAFADQHPGLAKRIHQKDLALHLGLTPVGLNRIVARLRRSAAPTPE
ncbi:Crp/Fnr family transcriptional regulator [Aquabacterium humicola]|uniref:Crp/Fnr family transcriptional regulator n=1 Tax=Aquabacterium humicola TaxID=3237377 RepID=UPI00254392E8|nr:Crp/Fnr family transcriptional regulator [Rubrivivax pictus]